MAATRVTPSTVHALARAMRFDELRTALSVLLVLGAIVAGVYTGFLWQEPGARPDAAGVVLFLVLALLSLARLAAGRLGPSLSMHHRDDAFDTAAWFVYTFGLSLLIACVVPDDLVRVAADLSGSTAAAGGALAVLTLYVLVAADWLLGRSLAAAVAEPQLRSPTPSLGRALAVGAVAIVAGAVLWELRPLFHGLALIFYQYPLVTWIPLAFGVAAVGAGALTGAAVGRGARAVGRGARAGGRGARAGGRAALPWRRPVTVVTWALCLVMLPSWQGSALYAHTAYEDARALPLTTQPRLLPKLAAQEYGDREGLRHEHLVLDPTSGALTWSAEHKPGVLPRGPSTQIALQPLDRLDGSLVRRPAGFDPAVSSVGPGSLRWRAHERRFFTRVEDPVIVPLAGGRAIAVAPYVGYRGFPVRRPYWQGVYVYHQDGRLEDLSPAEALRRADLRRSGRGFPERLARDLAEAYGYSDGALSVLADRLLALPAGGDRTEIGDRPGNRQPYLTNLGDGVVRWVTAASSHSDGSRLAALFLTDSTSGRTELWRPPPGRELLSSQGAVELTRNLPLEWAADFDDAGEVELRRVTEPRPVFTRGRLSYLVSVVSNPHHLATREPVDRTVLVDAHERAVTAVFDHADPEADDRLRARLAAGRRARAAD